MTKKPRPYYSLLVKYPGNTQYGIEYGDYDRDTVREEARDIREKERGVKTLVIATDTDLQADIDAMVAHINATKN